jgi:hypothetical protein
LCFGSQLIFDEIAWVKLHISAVCFAEPHFFLVQPSDSYTAFANASRQQHFQPEDLI